MINVSVPEYERHQERLGILEDERKKNGIGNTHLSKFTPYGPNVFVEIVDIEEYGEPVGPSLLFNGNHDNGNIVADFDISGEKTRSSPGMGTMGVIRKYRG